MFFRAATIADAPLLRFWDTKPHVHKSDPNDDWHWEYELQRDPEWRKLLIAMEGTEPVGFMQIIDPALEDSHYWGDVPPNLRAIDIWIGEEHNLARGYGTKMMQMAIAQCFADENVSAILIDPLKSNTKAHRFYMRLGFRFIEERKFGEDVCYVYRLDRHQQ